jgi:hypothetical protein
MFNKMLILASRFDFCGLYNCAPGFTLLCTNKASDFNDLVAPGKLAARIIFGVLHIGEVSDVDRLEMIFQARRWNENISKN